MKTATKNQIRMAIVIVCAALLAWPAMAAAEETLLLASLTRTKQAEEFKDFDFFPDYHREARLEEKARKALEMQEKKAIAADELIVQDAEWLSKNAIIPYEIITTDYVGLLERVFSKTKNLF